MLVLARKKQEGIRIIDRTTKKDVLLIEILEVKGSIVKIGIDGENNFAILRSELEVDESKL